MKKLLVYLDEDFHEDLKELAHRKKTSMSALVRYALDLTFEDELDVIAGERGLQEYLDDPASAITLDEFLEKHGIALPSGGSAKGGKAVPAASSKREAKGRQRVRAAAR